MKTKSTIVDIKIAGAVAGKLVNSTQLDILPAPPVRLTSDEKSRFPLS
jgi:hypothetical protein